MRQLNFKEVHAAPVRSFSSPLPARCKSPLWPIPGTANWSLVLSGGISGLTQNRKLPSLSRAWSPEISCPSLWSLKRGVERKHLQGLGSVGAPLPSHRTLENFSVCRGSHAISCHHCLRNWFFPSSFFFSWHQRAFWFLLFSAGDLYPKGPFRAPLGNSYIRGAELSIV